MRCWGSLRGATLLLARQAPKAEELRAGARRKGSARKGGAAGSAKVKEAAADAAAGDGSDLLVEALQLAGCRCAVVSRVAGLGLRSGAAQGPRQEGRLRGHRDSGRRCRRRWQQPADRGRAAAGCRCASRVVNKVFRGCQRNTAARKGGAAGGGEGAQAAEVASGGGGSGLLVGSVLLTGDVMQPGLQNAHIVGR